MTGRTLFKILSKVQFLFYPVSIYGCLWIKFFKPLCANTAIIFRYFMYLKCFKSIGNNVSIHKNVTIKHPNNISIGNNVSVHTLCYLDGEGGLSIGDNVSIAHNSSILTFNHSWADKDVPIKYNPKTFAPVTIKDNVWIGAAVRIMAGVTINERCIVAAGSVVTKDCEPNSIYAGIPARKIKDI